MPEKKNSQRLTKPEKLRNARLCNNDKSTFHLPRHSSFTINHTFAKWGNTEQNKADGKGDTTDLTTKGARLDA